MEGVLWYLLASSRGGDTRVRILRALEERPRNANQLATELDLDYTTVRHHLDVLLENNVVRTAGEDYGTVYLFTDQLEHNWETVRRRSPPPGGRCTTSPRTRRPVT
jgi:DNA-binding transcriptional ArsR family regulator